jgi:hypothetical protein
MRLIGNPLPPVLASAPRSLQGDMKMMNHLGVVDDELLKQGPLILTHLSALHEDSEHRGHI